MELHVCGKQVLLQTAIIKLRFMFTKHDTTMKHMYRLLTQFPEEVVNYLLLE